jgi:hypothetical protein
MNFREVFLLCSPEDWSKFMLENCIALPGGFFHTIEYFVVSTLPNSPTH